MKDIVTVCAGMVLLVNEIMHYTVAVECRGTKMLTNDSGLATSPGYPSDYDSQTDCAFIINAPVGQFIIVAFDTFELEPYRCRDHVKIYNGYEEDEDNIIGKFCGYESPGEVVSGENQLYITFHSDWQFAEQGFRFQWHFHKEGCPVLSIRGFVFEEDLNGNYTRTNEGCSGRPVYKQEVGYMRLFHMESAWYIAYQARHCIGHPMSKSRAFASDTAVLPDFIKAKWEEKDLYDDWYPQKSAKVECEGAGSDLSGGAIAGIVVTCLVIVVVPVSAITAIKIKKKRKALNQDSQQPNTNFETSAMEDLNESPTNGEIPETLPETVNQEIPERLPDTSPDRVLAIINDLASVFEEDPSLMAEVISRHLVDRSTDLPPTYDEVVSSDGQRNFPPVTVQDDPPPYRSKAGSVDQESGSCSNASNVYIEGSPPLHPPIEPTAPPL